MPTTLGPPRRGGRAQPSGGLQARATISDLPGRDHSRRFARPRRRPRRGSSPWIASRMTCGLSSPTTTAN